MKVTEKKFLNLHQTLSPMSTVNGKHGHHQNNNTISPTDQLHVAVSVPAGGQADQLVAPVTSVTSVSTNGHSFVTDDQSQDNKVSQNANSK